jgi:hypothetical protein
MSITLNFPVIKHLIKSLKASFPEQKLGLKAPVSIPRKKTFFTQKNGPDLRLAHPRSNSDRAALFT